jgi:hypothetical protein
MGVLPGPTLGTSLPMRWHYHVQVIHKQLCGLARGLELLI